MQLRSNYARSQSDAPFSESFVRAAVETLEQRQLLATIAMGELPLAYRQEFAIPNGANTYSFTLAKPTTVDAIAHKGNLTLKRNGLPLTSGASISRPLPKGTYSLEVKGEGGSPLLVRTSNFSPPTRLEAEVWGGQTIHLNWDDNTDAEAYYRVDRWTRLGWRRGVYVPANHTNAVIDNLVVGHATTYRVSAVTSTGESLRSANIVTATTLNEDTSGWYQLTIGNAAKGEAGWDIVNKEIGIWQEFRANGDVRKSKYIYATSWQTAVWQYATSLNADKTAQTPLTFDTHRELEGSTEIVAHTFPISSYFRIGTAGEIASQVAGYANNNGGFKVGVSEDTKLISIEDSKDSIDRDYDDFYWIVQADYRESLPDVWVGADGHGTENGRGVKFIFSRTEDSWPIDQPLVVKFSVGGTATAGQDYTILPNEVTIPANQLLASITFNPIDDSDIEFSETIEITLLDGDYRQVLFPDPYEFRFWHQHDVGFARNYLDDDDVGPMRPVSLYPAAAPMNTLAHDTRAAGYDPERESNDNCQSWAFNSTGASRMNSFQSATLPFAIEHGLFSEEDYDSITLDDLLRDAPMMKRVLEAMLYDPDAPVQGYRSYSNSVIPGGWHTIIAYHRSVWEGLDYHYATQALNPVTNLWDWTDKENEENAVRVNPYYESGTFLSHYLINTAPRDARAIP